MLSIKVSPLRDSTRLSTKMSTSWSSTSHRAVRCNLLLLRLLLLGLSCAGFKLRMDAQVQKQNLQGGANHNPENILSSTRTTASSAHSNIGTDMARNEGNEDENHTNENHPINESETLLLMEDSISPANLNSLSLVPGAPQNHPPANLPILAAPTRKLCNLYAAEIIRKRLHPSLLRR